MIGRATLVGGNPSQGAEIGMDLHLLFYTYPGPDGQKGVAGVCLEFGQYAWSPTLEEVQRDLIETVKKFFEELSILPDFEAALMEELGAVDEEPLWARYRQISTKLSLRGMRISPTPSTDVMNYILQHRTEVKTILASEPVPVFQSVDPELFATA